MKNNSVLAKVLMLGLAVASTMVMFGCGNTAGTTDSAQIEDEQVATAITSFTKGVYANYAAEAENPEKTYFYRFFGDGSGSIDDGAVGTSNFFQYQIGVDTVTFEIGSIDPSTEVFTVSSCEDGLIKGHFDDGVELVFEPIPDADPDTFSAVNYVNAANGEDLVYEGIGWQVRYNPELIQVNPGGPVTTFVYTGDCAGTCMITATYTVENNGKDAVKAMGEIWGDKTTYSEGIFPGTEDVPGYWAVLNGSPEEGSGLCQTVIGRDYLDGALLFEFTVHNCGDDAVDIPVSDALASIIDSIEFITYEN